jgi:hypothetical protein
MEENLLVFNNNWNRTNDVFSKITFKRSDIKTAARQSKTEIYWSSLCGDIMYSTVFLREPRPTASLLLLWFVSCFSWLQKRGLQFIFYYYPRQPRLVIFLPPLRYPTAKLTWQSLAVESLPRHTSVVCSQESARIRNHWVELASTNASSLIATSVRNTRGPRLSAASHPTRSPSLRRREDPVPSTCQDKRQQLLRVRYWGGLKFLGCGCLRHARCWKRRDFSVHDQFQRKKSEGVITLNHGYEDGILSLSAHLVKILNHILFSSLLCGSESIRIVILYSGDNQ